MWVFITLAVIVVAMVIVILCVTLPMCKEYDELFYEEYKKGDVTREEQGAQTKDNSGTSALNIENSEIKE